MLDLAAIFLATTAVFAYLNRRFVGLPAIIGVARANGRYRPIPIVGPGSGPVGAPVAPLPSEPLPTLVG